LSVVAPAVFRDVKLSNGDALIKGKKFTGFSNSEEEAYVPHIPSSPFSSLKFSY
jgi:hypothetical protein